MYVVIWEYVAVEGMESEFEKIYNSSGEWVQLFKRSDGYLGTDLIRDADIPRHYVTIDRWTSSAAYSAFQEKYREAYEKLHARCESLTKYEKLIGRGKMDSVT